MPRFKSDDSKTYEELEKEIKELEQKLAGKRKAKNAAERREKAEAEQARAYEEAKFNQEFVAKAKEINWGEGKTVYDVISGIIRPSVSPEPIQAMHEPEQNIGSLMGAYMDQLGTKPV